MSHIKTVKQTQHALATGKDCHAPCALLQDVGDAEINVYAHLIKVLYESTIDQYYTQQ